ncbi:MAG: DUF3256 family protein [Bacteroides sp.]|nr:DUF3256 family protein [Bacteroides sp.]MBD5377390.1 DUF3256 family protein [Bacteroides sp.]
MKKFLIAALTLLAAGAPAAMAQLTASKAFAEAPKSVFPLLEPNTRLDMLDYFNAGMSTPSKNNLGGGSAITALKPEFLSINMSDASATQLFLLPAANDTVIGVIRTVSTPALDSSMNLYTSQWQPLKKGAFTAPELKDWVTDSKEIDNVESVVPFMLVDYAYDPATATLTLTNNLKDFLSDDIYSMVSPFLVPSITYVWDGKRFNRTK